MRKPILWFLGLIISQINIINAQYENVWVFGKGAGLDFNSGDPVSISTAIVGFGEANASVCDKDGNLLFYTEGSYVWDRNHNLMPNGADITPVISRYPSNTPTGSTSQGALICPVPGTENHKYYIFSLTAAEHGDDAGKLFYSIVDMDANGGMGDVVAHQKGIFIDSGLVEKMTALIGDKCNIWLLTCTNAGYFQAFEITEAGLSTHPVSSTVGLGTIENKGGCMAVSPDGKKLAGTTIGENGRSINAAALYDFDVATGLVSNELILMPASGSFGSYGAYGVCFSPDNSKLYIAAIERGIATGIYQYDLSSINHDSILSSETFIGYAEVTHLKLAPNNKIYFIKNRANPAMMGMINFPNLKGNTCGYTANAVTFPGDEITHLGLPNVVPVYKKDSFLQKHIKNIDCFSTDSINIYASDIHGWDYKWDDGSDAVERTVHASGTYWVGYFKAPCTYTVDTFQVWLPSRALPSLQTTTSCIGESNAMAWLSVSAEDSASYIFIWRNNKNQLLSTSDSLTNVPSGKYTVQIRTSSGCDTILQVNLEDLKARVSFITDTLHCLTDTIDFENTSDPYFTDFNWTFGDQGRSNLRHPYYNYAKAGSYEVNLVGRGSLCTDTAYKTITIDAPVLSTFSIDKDSICIGEQVALSAFSDRSLLGFKWQLGDGSSLLTTDPGIRHSYDREGKMPIQLLSQFRTCPDTNFEDTVYVFPVPEIDLGKDSELCLNSKPLYLFNTIVQSWDYIPQWNTGETTDTIVIRQAGIYSLNLTTIFGCTAEESVNIVKSCYIEIPNAFTPNGDGVNDYFFPRRLMSKQLSRFHMKILNRWGKAVF